MILGGCSGSTSGGLKVSRVLVMLRTARFEIVKAFRPHKVFKMQVNGNSIDPEARLQTVIFVCLYCFLLFVSALIVGMLEFMSDIDFITAMGAALATLFNIGPGFGDVGPTSNFAHLLPVTKVFLSLLMILGRLELYAVLVLFVSIALEEVLGLPNKAYIVFFEYIITAHQGEVFALSFSD